MQNNSLYLSPGLEIVLVDDERLAFNLYGRRYTIRDESGLVRKIISAAAQGLSRPTFLEECEDDFPSEVIESTLKAMLEAKFIIEKDLRSSGDTTKAFLDHISGKNGAYGSNTSTESNSWLVVLVGEGRLADKIESEINNNGIALTRCTNITNLKTTEQSKIIVIASADDENHSFFREINDEVVKANLPCLFIALDWQMVRCGPLVIPKANACYECYFHRLSSTRKHPDEFNARSSDAGILIRPIPIQLSIQWAVAISITEILSYLHGVIGDLHLSPMREIDILKGKVVKSSLLKLPRCPICGSASTSRPVSSVINTKLVSVKA